MPFVWPIVGAKPGSNITNPFGGPQIATAGYGQLAKSSGQPGMDIGAASGTPIAAPANARVVSVGTGANSGWGNSVLLEDDAGNQHRLSHMRDVPLVKAGQRVSAGQQVGVVGMSGNATGSHLDWEYKPKSGGFANPMALDFSGDVGGPGMGASTGLPGGPPAPAAPPPGGPGGDGDKSKSALDRLRESSAALDKQIATTEAAAKDTSSAGEFARPRAIAALPDLYKQRSDLLLKLVELERNPAAANVPTIIRGNDLINTQTGAVIATLPSLLEVPPTALQGVQLQQAQVALATAQAALAQATSPEARRLAQLQVDTAQFNLDEARRKAGQPVDVAAQPTQQFLTRRDVQGNLIQEPNPNYVAPTPGVVTIGGRPFTWDAASESFKPATGLPEAPPTPEATPATQQFITRRDAQGNLIQEPNPNYTAPTLADPTANLQAVIARATTRATQERDRLLSLQEAGTITSEEARRRFEAWWSQTIDPEMAGARAMAERQQQEQQRALEGQQRTEDIRVQDINRQREVAAFGAGQEAVNQLRPILPQVRSEASLRQSAENVNRIGRGEAYQVSPEAFDPRGYAAYIPDLGRVAQEQAARFLANISPAAAQMINRPLPALPAAPNIQSILAGLNVPLPGIPGLPE